MKLTRMKWMIVVMMMTACLTVGLVLAGGDMLPRSLVSSGGSIVNQGSVSLHSAIGQPAIGTVANGTILCSGYLCDADAPPVSGGGHSLFLPFIKR
jgi:hypothetical protein